MPAKSITYHGIPVERCDGQLFSDEEVNRASTEEKGRTVEAEHWRIYMEIMARHMNPIYDDLHYVEGSGGHAVNVKTMMPDLNFSKSE